MKKVFLLLLLVLTLCTASSAALPDRDIVILYTNDVHCGVDENLGYAAFSFCAEEARKSTPYVTLVDAGDFAQGETIGSISQGRYIIQIMNQVGYDIVVPGNHEFDYGWAVFENFAKNLKSGFISCNMRDLRTGELIFKPYKILTYGSVKVAFVGVTTPESITKSTPSSFMDEDKNLIYDFDGEKIIDSIQKAVDSARAEGVDYVIIVGHLGNDGITEAWSSEYIARRTRGIDVFIDGHSHEVVPSMAVKNLDSQDVIITQTGTKLINVGRLTINTEGKIKTELLNDFDGRDEKIVKFVDEIKSHFAGTMNTHMSNTSFDLLAMDENGNWLLRNGETNLADLVADAFLVSARETKTRSADVAVVNAGTIRKNIKSGEITFFDVMNVLPFPNTICIFEVPGQTLIDELEVGARILPENFGGFLHVSGVTYTIDETVPSPVKLDEHKMFTGIEGKRRVSDVKINGEPVDPEKMYKVVSTNYVLRERGDGHAFNGSKMIEADYGTLADSLAHYLKDFETLPERYRKAQGRIKFIK